MLKDFVKGKVNIAEARRTISDYMRATGTRQITLEASLDATDIVIQTFTSIDPAVDFVRHHNAARKNIWNKPFIYKDGSVAAIPFLFGRMAIRDDNEWRKPRNVRPDARTALAKLHNARLRLLLDFRQFRHLSGHAWLIDHGWWFDVMYPLKQPIPIDSEQERRAWHGRLMRFGESLPNQEWMPGYYSTIPLPGTIFWTPDDMWQRGTGLKKWSVRRLPAEGF